VLVNFNGGAALLYSEYECPFQCDSLVLSATSFFRYVCAITVFRFCCIWEMWILNLRCVSR